MNNDLHYELLTTVLVFFPPSVFFAFHRIPHVNIRYAVEFTSHHVRVFGNPGIYVKSAVGSTSFFWLELVMYAGIARDT
jgi:hypothetical protein